MAERHSSGSDFFLESQQISLKHQVQRRPCFPSTQVREPACGGAPRLTGDDKVKGRGDEMDKSETANQPPQDPKESVSADRRLFRALGVKSKRWIFA